MFWSTALLVKNGKFAVVWRVAKDAKRVKKDEVISISVPAKCKELKECETPLALRLQAELANGIVKIFGFQVDYLFDDVTEAKVRLHDSSGNVDLIEDAPKESNLQDIEALDFLHESFHAELEQKLEALGDMDFEEMRRIVSASKSLDKETDPNRVDNSFELNMSIEKAPKPHSKFEESFEDYDNNGPGFSMFDFLETGEIEPEIIRREDGISMDFDETVVLSKEKDKKKDEDPEKPVPEQEADLALPNISRISQEPPSDRMEVEKEKIDEEKDDIKEKKDDENEEGKAKEKKKSKPRRRGKKRKWKDARTELTDSQISKQFDEKDQLVRQHDTSCFAKPPPTKKNMRQFRRELPEFMAQSRMPLGPKLQGYFSRQYTKMLEKIKEDEKEKLENELNKSFEQILAEPPPDPSVADPLENLSASEPSQNPSQSILGDTILTIPSSQNQSITIVEDVSELPSAQLDFPGGDDYSDSDAEKGGKPDFVPSTQTKETNQTILNYVEEGKGSASFFSFTKGKERHEVASMFFSTLVLKSKGRIDVIQKVPYDDIEILKVEE